MADQKNTPGEFPKLLIVDDRPENRFSLEACLEHLDLQIHEAASGPEALELIGENEYFLILLDVQMPGVSGFDVARRIHQNPETANIPIIFVTAINKDQAYVCEGYHTGAVDYMFKPLDADIIEQKVKVFLKLATQRQELTHTVNLLEETQAELKRSNKELEDFAHLASHDLRAPLRSIRSFSEILEAELEGKLDGSTVEILAMICQATGRMDTLILGLLEYARAKSQPAKFQRVDLSHCLQEVHGLLALRIREKEATIATGELPTIMGDPVLIQQVFRNLVDNALKYVKQGVLPHISISSIEDPVAGECRIVVQDNGIGFNDDQAEKIFKPFQRLVGKSEFEGSGMGMAVVQKIILGHGGQISARGIKGEGATFTVTLPMCQETMPALV